MFSLIILILELLCDVVYECLLNSTEKLHINQFLSYLILIPEHIHCIRFYFVNRSVRNLEKTLDGYNTVKCQHSKNNNLIDRNIILYKVWCFHLRKRKKEKKNYNRARNIRFSTIIKGFAAHEKHHLK